MIIDSHQHFWNYNEKRDTWINESMEILKKDFLPHDLEPILKQNKIDGCIAVQADQSEEETEFLLKCASENKFIYMKPCKTAGTSIFHHILMQTHYFYIYFHNQNL